MTTTGTTAFNLDMNDLIEEAFERAGLEVRTGYDFRTARRSINLLTIEWANRGINLWTIEQNQIPMVTGQVIYPYPVDTIDMYDTVIRTSAGVASNQTDINISRISESDYLTIPNKLANGRPIQVWIQRYNAQNSPLGLTLASSIGATDTTITLNTTVGLPASGFVQIESEIINYSYITGNTLNNCFRAQQNTVAVPHLTGATVLWAQIPAITVWPTPDAAQQYTFAYWRLRRTQDAGGGVNIMDVPFRFIPCMAAGLAYYIAGKIPPGAERLAFLKSQYDEAWELAAYEDHEKAALRFVPRQQFLGNTI